MPVKRRNRCCVSSTGINGSTCASNFMFFLGYARIWNKHRIFQYILLYQSLPFLKISTLSITSSRISDIPWLPLHILNKNYFSLGFARPDKELQAVKCLCNSFQTHPVPVVSSVASICSSVSVQPYQFTSNSCFYIFSTPSLPHI